MIIPITDTIFNSLESAKVVADGLNASDDDWTYEVDQSPINGKCVIKIYDEDGCFVANYFYV